MEAFEILIVFGDIVCKGKVVNNGSNIYRITMSDSRVGSIMKTKGRWKIAGDIASIINRSDIDIIGKHIEEYFRVVGDSIECNLLKKNEKCDIDLFKIALNLKPGRSEGFTCKGCNIRAVYKDVNGCLFVAKQEGRKIKLSSVNIDELMG